MNYSDRRWQRLIRREYVRRETKERICEKGNEVIDFGSCEGKVR